jgi:hypothetical protein
LDEITERQCILALLAPSHRLQARALSAALPGPEWNIADSRTCPARVVAGRTRLNFVICSVPSLLIAKKKTADH